MKLVLLILAYLLPYTLGDSGKYYKLYVIHFLFNILCLCFVDINRNYVVEEEDEHRLSYLLVETENGYEIEDLTDHGIQLTTSATDVVYYLCTQLSRNGTLVNNVTSDWPVEVFNPEKEVLVLIHGWKNDYSAAFNSYIKSAVLDKFNINVIIVDWSSFSKQFYLIARNVAPEIGKYVGGFIESLASTYNIPLSKISFVGHSLGAHVSGVAGKTLGGKANNIVGLDPAAPLVSISDKDYCLDSSDADYVQVIHTNGAFLGLSTSLGHADYYPNGGKKQPGCGLDLTGNCSHGRSFKYYAESIRKNRFISQECESYADFTQGKCNGTFSFMGGYTIDKE